MSPVELILVRHGETVLGGGAFLGGQVDPPLSAVGVTQATHVGRRLAMEPVTAIFTSPFRRTLDTAQPLAALTGLTPSTVPELREVHLGELEQLVDAEPSRQQAMREVLQQDRWDVAADAESAEAFAERIAEALSGLASAVGPGGRAVAFVHGGVIAEACRQATGSRALAFVPLLRHASITRLEHHRSRLLLAVFNDVAHLEGHGAT